MERSDSEMDAPDQGDDRDTNNANEYAAPNLDNPFDALTEGEDPFDALFHQIFDDSQLEEDWNPTKNEQANECTDNDNFSVDNVESILNGTVRQSNDTDSSTFLKNDVDSEKKLKQMMRPAQQRKVPPQHETILPPEMDRPMDPNMGFVPPSPFATSAGRNRLRQSSIPAMMRPHSNEMFPFFHSDMPEAPNMFGGMQFDVPQDGTNGDHAALMASISEEEAFMLSQLQSSADGDADVSAMVLDAKQQQYQLQAQQLNHMRMTTEEKYRRRFLREERRRLIMQHHIEKWRRLQLAQRRMRRHSMGSLPRPPQQCPPRQVASHGSIAAPTQFTPAKSMQALQQQRANMTMMRTPQMMQDGNNCNQSLNLQQQLQQQGQLRRRRRQLTPQQRQLLLQRERQQRQQQLLQQSWSQPSVITVHSTKEDDISTLGIENDQGDNVEEDYATGASYSFATY